MVTGSAAANPAAEVVAAPAAPADRGAVSVPANGCGTAAAAAPGVPTQQPMQPSVASASVVPAGYMQQPVYAQQGMYGQQPFGGMYGQPSVYGQQGMPLTGQPGFMGQLAQPGAGMEPQYNFRTMIRFIMEMAAIIQGCSLIGMMASGWAQEIGSNEEQPLRKVAVWMGRSLQRAISAVVPFYGSRRKQSRMEGAWETEVGVQQPTTRWWVVFGVLYFGIALFQEATLYRRLQRLVAQPGEAPLAIATSAAGPHAPPSATSSAAGGAAEGDAAGGGKSRKDLLQLYMEKQQEMHRQRMEEDLYRVY